MVDVDIGQVSTPFITTLSMCITSLGESASLHVCYLLLPSFAPGNFFAICHIYEDDQICSGSNAFQISGDE